MLLIRSSSLFNNGLFIDWRLWLGVSLGIVAISAACWLPFVRGLTRSVTQMSRVTGKIAQGQFDVQVDDARRDELGQLGAQINELASRLERFVKSQKRILGDIAHELSAPIARIQFALGILEQKGGEGGQLREEIQEMSSLVNELLWFSKAGMDAAGVALMTVTVAQAVSKAVARESGAARIDVSVDPALTVRANEMYLTRAIANVLRNAVRYAADAGPIEVRACREGANVFITIADYGPGLPGEALSHVFTPFYRPETSRSRETGGVGLGLAIVKSCIEACKGAVSCRNRPSGGLEVTITLAAA